MKEDIFQKIKDIIAEYSEIDVNEINMESSLMELDLSSIEMISVVAEVQRINNIMISTEEMMTIQTIKNLVELIEEKTA